MFPLRLITLFLSRFFFFFFFSIALLNNLCDTYKEPLPDKILKQLMTFIDPGHVSTEENNT